MALTLEARSSKISDEQSYLQVAFNIVASNVRMPGVTFETGFMGGQFYFFGVASSQLGPEVVSVRSRYHFPKSADSGELIRLTIAAVREANQEMVERHFTYQGHHPLRKGDMDC